MGEGSEQLSVTLAGMPLSYLAAEHVPMEGKVHFGNNQLLCRDNLAIQCISVDKLQSSLGYALLHQL